MALISSAKGNGTTAAASTTGATLIVLGLRNEGAPATPVSDSAANTWVERARTSTTEGYGVRMYYCINPTTSATHTFTNGLGAAYPIVMSAFDNASVTFDKDTGTNNGGGTNHTTLTVGGAGLTPAQAQSIVASVCLNFKTGVDLTTLTIASGGWTVNQYQDNGATNMDLAIAHKFLTSAVATAADWSWTGQGDGAGHIAVFAATVPAVGGGPLNRGLTRSPLLNGRCIA